MKKKILFVYPEMMIGGSTTSLLSLLNGLDQHKYEIYLQLYRNKGPLLSVIPEHVHLLPEVEMYGSFIGKVKRRIRFVISGYFFKSLKYNKNKCWKPSKQIWLDYLAKYCCEYNNEMYDIAVGALEGWSDRYVAYRISANKKICWIHSVVDKIAEYPLLERNWISLVDKVVSVSQSCDERFRELIPQEKDKSIYCDNIMDTSLVRKQSELIDNNDSSFVQFVNSKEFKIVSICRLDIVTKGLDRMIQCAARMKSEGRVFKWYIIGDGKDSSQLKSLIEKYNVKDCFIAIGLRSNPYPFLRHSDIMCMASRWEGMPITVTESKMLGTPPVVTAYISVGEQIEHGVEGIVVENTDDSIYEAIKICMDNPEMIQRIRSYLLSHEYGNRNYIKKIEADLF